VKPESLPAWHRVRAANAIATSGQTWATVLAQHNSGTYNNQVWVFESGFDTFQSSL